MAAGVWSSSHGAGDGGIADRGLVFLDSRTSPASAGIRLAIADGVPHAARDVFPTTWAADLHQTRTAPYHHMSPEEMRARADECERMAASPQT